MIVWGILSWTELHPLLVLGHVAAFKFEWLCGLALFAHRLSLPQTKGIIDQPGGRVE